jgi:hypothetical protein
MAVVYPTSSEFTEPARADVALRLRRTSVSRRRGVTSHKQGNALGPNTVGAADPMVRGPAYDEGIGYVTLTLRVHKEEDGGGCSGDRACAAISDGAWACTIDSTLVALGVGLAAPSAGASVAVSAAASAALGLTTWAACEYSPVHNIQIAGLPKPGSPCFDVLSTGSPNRRVLRMSPYPDQRRDDAGGEMSKHVGVRNRIVVAVSSLGLLIMLRVIALGLADIAGTSDRFSLLVVAVVAVCVVAVLGIRTHRSRR